MATKQRQEQLTNDEVSLVNSTRGQLKAFADKLRLLLEEADAAVIHMDAQLNDAGAAPPA